MESLPEPFTGWLTRRGWRLRAHQAALLAHARAGRSALLVAPTGAGKTLAGFLPSLAELAAAPRKGLHTLYISPLKALAVDVHRNVETPIAEMKLEIRAETRTGDTPSAKRVRQRKSPPHILMTTPESLALMLSYPDAGDFFARLSCIVVDEVHALAGTKRGDLLSLGLARLAALAPEARRVGLSATVADPPGLAKWLAAGQSAPPAIVEGERGADPDIAIVVPAARIPWSGHIALHALPEIYLAIRNAKSAIVFVNTRAQAELCFRELWKLNEDNLEIALHHGSLAPEQRRKVEAAMAAGKLRAVVATSSLDLGIDWGDVDLVIQIGAPKGAARLIQRTGRANHRLDSASKALLVPGNRFEMLECRAAIDAVMAREIDALASPPGGRDVLAQHLLGTACCAPFDADAMYVEVRACVPYESLSRAEFDAVLDFVATGGYALKAYERYRRLRQTTEGRWTVATPLAVRQYRMNVGTIVEEPMLHVAFRRGKRLGSIEEYFVMGLEPGDTFTFAGQTLRYEGMRETTVEVTRATGDDAKVPIYAGGRMPFTSEVALRVRGLLEDVSGWDRFPADVREWLRLQRRRSEMPRREGLLVETFPHHGRWFLVAYCFAGRNAHQTLGMLLTKRMMRAGQRPIGFVASDYSIAVWSVKPAERMAELFDEDMLGDDLEAWLADSAMIKRCFRNVAVIAGLIERRHPGQEKTGRQVTFSSDLIYDVLRKHQPDHMLLQAARADAAAGLVDVSRLAAMLKRARGKITHRRLTRVSPLAVPVLLEVGRESVYGAQVDDLLADAAAAEALIAEATAEDDDDRQASLL
ncbi:MAG: ligase-associated DNA damage response DEXH box helicase [Alphaproteobacteria bacterium]|nr:ligase-associated DNA damage response DEXH box helicase [Alphaproteobacteria bacterium]